MPVDDEYTERRRLASNCFGCGSRNPIGLRLHFRMAEDGSAVAQFTPRPEHQGYPGHMHGGLVTTMLDEAMGWATYGQSIWALTARMTVRFREPVLLSGTLTVRGWIERNRGRILELRSELRSSEGTVLAEAEGVFTPIKGERAEQVARAFYQASLAD